MRPSWASPSPSSSSGSPQRSGAGGLPRDVHCSAVDRRWENAGGRLAGFLAYDLVLLIPFVVRILSGSPSYYGSSSEPLRPNLLYTAVVLLSGVLAAYYLFIHGPTRMPSRRPGSRWVEAANDAQEAGHDE